MPKDRISNVIGFDDAPFERVSFEKVQIVGTVYTGFRLNGLLIGEIERDGSNTSKEMDQTEQVIFRRCALRSPQQ